MRTFTGVSALALSLAMGASFADTAAIQSWVAKEFQPSTLDQSAQVEELEWFAA